MEKLSRKVCEPNTILKKYRNLNMFVTSSILKRNIYFINEDRWRQPKEININ